MSVVRSAVAVASQLLGAMRNKTTPTRKIPTSKKPNWSRPGNESVENPRWEESPLKNPASAPSSIESTRRSEPNKNGAMIKPGAISPIARSFGGTFVQKLTANAMVPPTAEPMPSEYRRNTRRRTLYVTSVTRSGDGK